MKNKLSLLALILFFISTAGCGGGSSSGDSGGGGTESTEDNFSGASQAITIDDIANSTAPSALSAVSTNSEAEFYFGRFLVIDGGDLSCGVVKFKLNKENDSFAYFSDFTVEYASLITGISTNIPLITSSTDTLVPSGFNASTNSVSIVNATERFVAFNVTFGAVFGSIVDAGVLFSSNFTTMIGGDNESFIFIAQKADSQPDTSLASLLGDWALINFTVGSLGDIFLGDLGVVTIGGTGGNGFTAFSGFYDITGAFGGELTLNDATCGAFIFGLSADGSTTAASVDGVFLISADELLVLGYNVFDEIYFAAERL